MYKHTGLFIIAWKKGLSVTVDFIGGFDPPFW